MTVIRSNHPTVSLAGSMYRTFNLGAGGGGGGGVGGTTLYWP